MEQTCPLCAQDTCLLDFSLPCCTARYIARLKSLEQRKGWMERIRKRKPAEFMAQVEAHLLAIWQERKQCERN